MKAFLQLIFLFILLFFISINTAFAADEEFNYTQNPNPATVQTEKMWLSIQRKDGKDQFVPTLQYSFAAWRDSDEPVAGNVCTQTNFSGNPWARGTIDVTPSTATAGWNVIATCREIGKLWHFRLWAGDGWDAMRNNIIIKDYQFTLTQAGGQLISISCKNPGCNVFAGQQPIVILSNATTSTTPHQYTFWWDGNKTMIARYFPEANDSPGQLEVAIPFGNFDFNERSRRLCMEYGDFRFPPGANDCNPSVTFNFFGAQTPPPVSGSAKCSILPSNQPPIGSEVNVKVENVPNGTNVSAYATDSTGNQFTPSSATADSTNTASLNLIRNAIAGRYTTTVFNGSTGQKLCPDLAFNVSFTPGTGPYTLPAPCSGRDCSAAGGEMCVDSADPDNPGIKTAIGCIRTSPVKLVKNILTFVLGIGGGFAFLMMLLGAFQMLTSGGNPETLAAGRSRLTSAVIGLLFVIFAVLLLQIIGGGILRIPGFS